MIEKGEAYTMGTDNNRIKSSTLIRIVIVIFLLMMLILVWKLLSLKQEYQKEEIYIFYITDENQNLLMQGGIDTAELVETESDEGTVYSVMVNFTDDAAVTIENITESNLNKSIQLHLDNELILLAPITEVIGSGQIFIPANSEDHGQELAFKLRNTEM